MMTTSEINDVFEWAGKMAVDYETNNIYCQGSHSIESYADLEQEELERDDTIYDNEDQEETIGFYELSDYYGVSDRDFY